MTNTETLKMALEALKFAYNDCESAFVRDEKIDPAINAIVNELGPNGQDQQQKELAERSYLEWLKIVKNPAML
jgi:hypothetical protein